MALQLTDANFKEEALASDKLVVVDFWAEWCGPCKMLGPIIEELANDFEGTAKIAKMDIDDNQETPAEYGIRSIPTVLFFKNGELVDKVVGVQPKEELAKKIQGLI